MAADGDGSDDGDQRQNLLREIERLRENLRQAHVENVQIAVASLIIGSYFTRVVQSFNPIGDAWYTDLIIVVAAGFLLAKLVALSAQEMGLSRLERIAGSAIAPMGFTITVAGYSVILVAHFAPVNVTVSTPLLLTILTGLAVLGSGAAVLTYWRAAAGYSMYDAAAGAEDAHTIAERFFRMVSDYPSVVEPGLRITAREEAVQDDVFVDFVGEDSEGRSVAVELKWLGQRSDVFAIARTVADDFEEVSGQFDRIILATNTELSEREQERLQEFGLEHRTIDEYQVFGRLSGVIKWLDSRFSILSRDVGS